VSGVDLVQWLRAQLDIDAARATAAAAAEEDGPDWRYDGHAVITRREGDLVAVGSQDFMESERGEFIAEHDPARVLREIDAKRRLLSEYADVAANETDNLDEAVEYADGWANGLGLAVRLLALPYADRPGYLESWRP
jgi:hypothetical protein